MNPRQCPLVTSDSSLIRRLLTRMSPHDLIVFTEQVFNSLSVSEKVTYNIHRYCTEYSDLRGRINFIKALIDRAVISIAHIPFDYHRDPRLVELLRRKSL